MLCFQLLYNQSPSRVMPNSFPRSPFPTRPHLEHRHSKQRDTGRDHQLMNMNLALIAARRPRCLNPEQTKDPAW